ncbi:MAG: hypothetical protein OXC48_10435, partial [Endozoicomonadaceae bacterium]|nr:hypothetical protein [Endozoicomonadaceae bacterium]
MKNKGGTTIMEQIQKSLAYLFLSVCLVFAPGYADDSDSDNSAELKSKYSYDFTDIQRYQYEYMLPKNKKQKADLFNFDIGKAFLSHSNYQQNSRDTDKNRLIISEFSLSLINIQTKINLLKEE